MEAEGKKGAGSFLATTPGVLTACLVSCLLWGSAFPCVKIGYSLLGLDSEHLPSLIAFAGARFLISGAMVIAGMSLAKRRAFVPARTDWKAILWLCLFQTALQYLLFYIGLTRSSGVVSAVIEASNCFLTVLLAAFLFKTEKFTANKALGCVVGFAGVVLVNVGPHSGSAGLVFGGGELLLFLSTIAAATSSNLAKRFASEGHDPILLSGWQFLVGGGILFVIGVALGGRVAPAPGTDPAPAVAMLLYLGFISAAAYSLWSAALAVNPVSRIAVFGFMNPVFGVILSALLLDESSVLNPLLAVVALAMVSLGIVVVNRPGKRAAEQA